MNSRKARSRKTIRTVLEGFLLLVILSTLFSTITSLFMASLMEGGVNSFFSKSDILSEQVSVPEAPAQEDPEKPVSPALAQDNTDVSVSKTSESDLINIEDIFHDKLVSMKPIAAVMWSALSLLFLMTAVILRHEGKHNLFRYGIGAVLFACCAVIFLISEDDSTDRVYRITAILHMLGMAADHFFSVAKNHNVRNTSFRALGVLLLGAGLVFNGRTALIYVLALTIPRIFYYIARISFSQVKMDVLRRIIRKTFAAEILFGMLLLITAFSIVLPNFEMSITSFGDALWYCFEIVTTIGFGDLAAVTLPGRIISVIVGLYGLIVVALITSIIVNFYNETKNVEDEDEEA